MVREAGAGKEDKRQWRDIMKERPDVREMLYSTRKLFLRSASGAGEEKTWRESLIGMLTFRDWSTKEQEVLQQLILLALNEEHEQEHEHKGDVVQTALGTETQVDEARQDGERFFARRINHDNRSK